MFLSTFDQNRGKFAINHSEILRLSLKTAQTQINVPKRQLWAFTVEPSHTDRTTCHPLTLLPLCICSHCDCQGNKGSNMEWLWNVIAASGLSFFLLIWAHSHSARPSLCSASPPASEALGACEWWHMESKSAGHIGKGFLFFPTQSWLIENIERQARK